MAQIVIKNDLLAFTERAGLRLAVMLDFEEGLRFSTSLYPGDMPVLNWTRDAQCGVGRLEVNVFSGQRLITGIRSRLNVKCPADIDMYAVTRNLEDGQMTRRAESGETLYIIDQSGYVNREVKFNIVSEAANEDFWEGEPQWSSTAHPNNTAIQNNHTKLLGLQFRQEHFPNVNAFPFGGNPELSYTVGVDAFEQSKEVKVVTFTENRRISNLSGVAGTSLGSLVGMFERTTNWINSMNSRLSHSPLGQIPGFHFDISSSLSAERYNGEDRASRHYFNYMEDQFNGHFSFSTSGADGDEFWIPAWHWDLGNVGEAGIFLRTSFEFNPHVDFVKRKYSRNVAYNYYRSEFVAGLTSDFGIGAKAILAPHSNHLNVSASGYASMRVTAEGSINIYEDSTADPNTLDLLWYVDPFNLTFQIHIQVSGYELINYDDTWHFFDRIQLGPASFILNNTSD